LTGGRVKEGCGMRKRLTAILMLAVSGSWAGALEVPASSAYASPDPERGFRRDGDGGVSGWEAGTRLSWYGRLEARGRLVLALRTAGPASVAKLRLRVEARGAAGPSWLLEGRRESGLISFGPVEIPAPGDYGFILEGEGSLPDLKSLRLDGAAAEGARFSTAERRNAASVHLAYPVADDVKEGIEWFYLELTPRTDPLWSYYMATGWHRGYFGMQVNGPGERRIIFSVWDAGDEPVDRGKVAQERRVRLLAKGLGVHAGDFGNEGTGGHSHLVYPWKLGDTLHFLTRAEVAGAATVYTGWFRDSRESDWRLVASFRAPEDGRHLRGLYSFNENFSGVNGDQRRVCEFGNGWVRARSGDWIPLVAAAFSHDSHGEVERLDRSAGLAGGRFYLANGGFMADPAVGAVTRAGAMLRLPATAGRPPAALPAR
jgi:hypothetical protein